MGQPQLLSSHGSPDILISGNAIINQNAPLWQVPSDEFDRLFDINVKGVANVIRHFVPAMIACKSGLIINFSSAWGRTVAADVAPYSRQQMGIEGDWRKPSPGNWPRGMAAIPLNPGVIDTDMLRSCFGGTASRYPSPQKWVERGVPFILNRQITWQQQLTVEIRSRRASGIGKRPRLARNVPRLANLGVAGESLAPRDNTIGRSHRIEPDRSPHEHAIRNRPSGPISAHDDDGEFPVPHRPLRALHAGSPTRC